MVWDGLLIIAATVFLIGLCAPFFILAAHSIRVMKHISIDRKNTLNCCYCGQTKFTGIRGAKPKIRIRKFYAFLLIKCFLTSVLLFIVTALLYFLTIFVIIQLYPSWNALCLPIFLLAYFSPLPFARLISHFDERSIQFVLQHEPTCLSCSVDFRYL